MTALPVVGWELSPKSHDTEYGPVPPVIVAEKLEGLPVEIADGGVRITATGCGEIVTVWETVAVTPLASLIVRMIG